MRAIAIDDEPIALDVIRLHAAKVSFLKLDAEFTDAFKAMEYLQNEPVDLIFLDIKMPDISGIDFLQSLSRKPMVIFTTAYSEHAVLSFELDAIDYLLKPFALARFVKACNKAYELYRLRQPDLIEKPAHLFIKTGYEQVKVFFTDIDYLEAAGNYVSFVIGGHKTLTRMTINEAEALLPPERFMRIHRSYIVAHHKIDRIERHQVWLGKIPLPMGATYAQNVLKTK